MTSSAVQAPAAARDGERAAVVPYVGPIVIFGLLTVAEGWLPADYYVACYAAKALAVTAALLYWRSPLADIRPAARVVVPSVLIGLVVFGMWVTLDTLVPYAYLGSRTAFNPFTLDSPAQTWVFLAVRFYGLALLVPVMEELFWRSFLLRYLTGHPFQAMPIGRFSTSALLIMVAASALSHPEWLAAALASLAYAGWLRRTGSLFGVIVAHAATNLALGGWVVSTGQWMFW